MALDPTRSRVKARVGVVYIILKRLPYILFVSYRGLFIIKNGGAVSPQKGGKISNGIKGRAAQR